MFFLVWEYFSGGVKDVVMWRSEGIWIPFDLSVLTCLLGSLKLEGAVLSIPEVVYLWESGFNRLFHGSDTSVAKYNHGMSTDFLQCSYTDSVSGFPLSFVFRSFTPIP